MEQFCGSLLPAIKSRRFPYASIDRRVTELAQLDQIKVLYGLHQQQWTYGNAVMWGEWECQSLDVSSNSSSLRPI